MDYINDLPPAVQGRLPEGPKLTDWLLAELERAHAAVVRGHALGCQATCRGPQDTLGWLKMAGALVLKHQSGPTYVNNVVDPTGPDMPGGWHCQECGLGWEPSTDDWPCEMLVMVATTLWHAQRPNQPVAWAWTPPEDQLIWRREDADGRTTGPGREPVEPEFPAYDAAGPDGDMRGMNIAAAPD